MRLRCGFTREGIMNQEPPHEVRRFADGEAIPEGWVELTEEEFEELDVMAAVARARWLKEHKERTPIGKLRDQIQKSKFEDALDVDLVKEQSDLRREQLRSKEKFDNALDYGVVKRKQQTEQRHRAQRRSQGR